MPQPMNPARIGWREAVSLSFFDMLKMLWTRFRWTVLINDDLVVCGEIFVVLKRQAENPSTVLFIGERMIMSIHIKQTHRGST